MLTEAPVEHCSPTLAGIKTGNLFSMRTNEKDVTEEIRELNGMLVQKGLRLIPLRKRGDLMLIYLYRPERLRADLAYPEAVSILREKGYPCGSPELCLMELIRHLVTDQAFPHEIGLFLGYPPSDVRGFMNSPREGVTCSGCWKVYGDPEKAEKLFLQYKKCTAVYLYDLKRGAPLEALVVDARAG